MDYDSYLYREMEQRRARDTREYEDLRYRSNNGKYGDWSENNDPYPTLKNYGGKHGRHSKD